MTQILVAIAVWRITHLLTKNDGPFDVLTYIRKFFWDRFSSVLMGCHECLSIWVGLAAALIFYPEQWFVYTLVFSAASMFMEELYGMLRK